ncbi:hypothetical protein MRX96_024860 [Rhipicephalus microplus]
MIASRCRCQPGTGEAQEVGSCLHERGCTREKAARLEHLDCTEEVVTDNGPQFTAKSFTEFLFKNGVRLTRTPPYHPASNGSAERCVLTEQDLTRQLLDERSSGQSKTPEHRIDLFLFRYRNTPTTTTGQTPAELCRGRPALA